MLPATVESALNEQMNAEMYSSYLYLGMGAQFATKGLNGCRTGCANSPSRNGRMR